MNSLEDFVRWIAQQNVIHLDDNQIKKFTNWLIRNEKYKNAGIMSAKTQKIKNMLFLKTLEIA